jgi:16S rRNA (guanine527-N7)-methyltransferase
VEVILKYFTNLSSVQIEQFRHLDKLYREWNKRINVISRKDIGSLYEKHVLHSLSIALVYPFQKNMEILDLGTGGGFPGIPLAIYFPHVRFYLVDSIGKKIKVVDEIVLALGLRNVATRHIRVEEIRKREFDFVVSRAVAPLADLWKWSRPLLKAPTTEQNAMKPGLICLKGGNLEKEIQESNTSPEVTDISLLFDESYFTGKFILYLPATRNKP